MPRSAASSRFKIRNFPYSVSCDGTVNGYIDFGTHATYALNTGAVSVWFHKRKQGVGTQGGINIQHSIYDRITLFHNTDKWDFGLVRGGAVILNAIITTNDLMNGWHHILFTWDGSSAVVYLDGNTTPFYSSNGNYALSFPGNPQMLVGAIPAGTFPGNFTNLSLYNAKLTGADAQNIYLNNKLPSSVVSFWDFSAGSGNVALTSGSGNAGTLGSGSAWSSFSPCKPRSASPANRFLIRNFPAVVRMDNTSNGKVDFGTHASYKLNTGTISFWVFEPAQGGTKGCVELATGANDRISILFNSDQIGMSIVKGGAVLYNTVFDSTPKKYENGWHHFRITWDATSMQVYVDGNSTPIVNSVANFTLAWPSNPQLTIGYNAINGGATLAYFSRLRLFSTKASGTDEQEGFYRGATQSGLVASWDLADGSGSTATLTAGSGNNGTLGSGASWETTNTPGKKHSVVT